MIISEMIDGRLQKRECNPTFERTYDVIVTGLGTAGTMAALVAAKNSLSVLGTENLSCVGGTTTAGGIQWHYFGCPGGQYLDVDAQINDFKEKYTFNQLESRKIVAENMLIQNGVDILYDSVVCGVYMEKKTVVGVRVITPDGIKDFGSSVILDCTGDAHTAHLAHCKTVFGRKSDGLNQPYTMVTCYRDGDKLHNTNMDFGRIDHNCDKELSAAMVHSRSKDMEPYIKGRIVSQMPLLGIRDGRRIDSQENIYLQDILEEKFTQNPIFYAYADLDKHGKDIAFDAEYVGDWSTGANLGAYNITVPVPYGALVPKEIDGILVPCRALGADSDICGCVRMVPSMKKAGEAGAVAAAIAIELGCPLRLVPYDELKKRLHKSGCLDDEHNRGYCIDGINDTRGNLIAREKITFETDPSRLEEVLCTLKPGRAIWASHRLGKKALPYLLPLIESNDENTRKHAAFALAMAGSCKGNEVLRTMASDRDPVMLHDCRKGNKKRGCMAIYLLGKTADKNCVDNLIEIISDKNEILHPAYTNNAIAGNIYDVKGFCNDYFQFVSHSVAALVKIGNAHKELRAKIADAFHNAFDTEDYCRRITTLENTSGEYELALNIRKFAFSAIKNW